MQHAYDPLKRCIDICLASAALMALLPVMAAVWTVVRLSVGAPALFLQTRAGRAGKPFTLVKFRTMATLRDGRGPPLADDARLTGLGRFLRETSLDELPQLWNVLSGSMSLIGPRPLLPEYLPLYSAQQARRHEVRPGMTGWAQINGRNSIDWSVRFAMDVWYVDNRSLVLDFRILVKSIWIVLLRRGALPLDKAPPFQDPQQERANSRQRSG